MEVVISLKFERISAYMPDPKFVKPWHGIPREQINWHPIVDENTCIGCGT